MSGITRDDWLKALGSESVKICNPEAMSVADLSELTGVGRGAVYKHMKKMVREGRAVATWKQHPTAGRPVPAFLLKVAAKSGTRRRP